MSEKGAIGLMGVLTVAAGYGVFGWIGALGGLMALGLMAAVRTRNPLAKGYRPVAGGIQRTRLEALMRKAHLLADTFQDAYGARHYCLEIIRQTEREDPLFLAACELFMRTMTPPPADRSAPVLGREPVAPRRDAARPAPDEANVIPFPLSSPRP